MSNDYLQKFNKVFENRIRLGIMSVLMVNDSVEFTRLKELLQASDGNLASHLSSLEKEGYVAVIKQFVNRKPVTSYATTAAGKKAFSDHLNTLEKLIKNSGKK
ncbi:MAG TPA: transcriptional regulator [Bacteroidia bacterium]|jgi:DNA-binding PadR family transcriptional regulator|nr:transcriptional regulator [Bacteroidia bacterium]